MFIRTGDKELFYTKISCDLEQAVYNNIKLWVCTFVQLEIDNKCMMYFFALIFTFDRMKIIKLIEAFYGIAFDIVWKSTL